MPKVKIDGVQEVEDALTATEAGADFIGMVFVPDGRRRVSVDQACQVVDAVKSTSDNPPKLIGLFAEQPLEVIIETVHESQVDMIQLCGNESVEFCDNAPVPVFKTIHVPAGSIEPKLFNELRLVLKVLAERGHFVTLDRKVVGLWGGTGRYFDWEVAKKFAEAGFEFMLAGGLTPTT